MNFTVNRETVNDRAKLILHRLVARSLRANPALLENARTRLQSLEGPAPDHVIQWARVLDRSTEEAAGLIGSRSEHMTQLRVSSPFRLSEIFDDEACRRRVCKKAKLGAAS